MKMKEPKHPRGMEEKNHAGEYKMKPKAKKAKKSKR